MLEHYHGIRELFTKYLIIKRNSYSLHFVELWGIITDIYKVFKYRFRNI